VEGLRQHQRKQAKRDYMRLVARYEAELKEAQDYGLDPHHHPEPPEDPDFGELEDEHQMARLNLERLSARRISCVSLIENVLQYLRLCSLVLPSRVPGLAGETFTAVLSAPAPAPDQFSLYASPTRNKATLTTDDIHAQFRLIHDVQDEDELKILWLQVTLWLEAALVGIEFAD